MKNSHHTETHQINMNNMSGLFSFQRVLNIDELCVLRIKYKRLVTLGKFIKWGSYIAAIFIIPTIFRFFADQVFPLVMVNLSDEEFLKNSFVNAASIMVACLGYLMIVITINKIYFRKSIQIRHLLNELSDSDAKQILELAKANSSLEKYRQQVTVSSREFVIGDMYLMQRFYDAENNHTQAMLFNEIKTAYAGKGEAVALLAGCNIKMWTPSTGEN